MKQLAVCTLQLVVSLYVSMTTTNLVTTRIRSSIGGLQDLPGKVVGTWSIPGEVDYVQVLQRYGVSAVGFPWNNPADELVMLNALQNRSLDALVLDASALRFRASNSCDIFVVGEPFNVFDQAIAFPPGTNESWVSAFDHALVVMLEDGTLQQLESKYISLPSPHCNSDGTSTSKQSITLSQVGGLWIILGVAVGIVAVWLFAEHVIFKCTQRRSKSIEDGTKEESSEES